LIKEKYLLKEQNFAQGAKAATRLFLRVMLRIAGEKLGLVGCAVSAGNLLVIQRHF
jgi:hypothetical protein